MPQNHDISNSTDIEPIHGETITEEHLSRAEFHPDLVDYRKHGLTVTPDWSTNTIAVDAGLAVLQQDVTAVEPYRAINVRVDPAVDGLTLETSSGTNYVFLYVDPGEDIDQPPYGIHIDTDQTALTGADNLLLATVDTANQEYSQRNTTAPLAGSGGGGGGGGDTITLDNGDGPVPFNQHNEIDPSDGEFEIAQIPTESGQVAQVYSMSLMTEGTDTTVNSNLTLRVNVLGGSMLTGASVSGNEYTTWSDNPPESAAGDILSVTLENTGSSNAYATPAVQIERETQ